MSSFTVVSSTQRIRQLPDGSFDRRQAKTHRTGFLHLPNAVRKRIYDLAIYDHDRGAVFLPRALPRKVMKGSGKDFSSIDHPGCGPDWTLPEDQDTCMDLFPWILLPDGPGTGLSAGWLASGKSDGEDTESDALDSEDDDDLDVQVKTYPSSGLGTLLDEQREKITLMNTAETQDFSIFAPLHSHSDHRQMGSIVDEHLGSDEDELD